MPESTPKKNIVVVGGSFAGTRIVELLAERVYKTHRVILIEKNSHFQHLFAFPRVSVVPGYERMAFIPFTNMFNTLPVNSTVVVHGTVTEVQQDKVALDNGETISYDFLVIASGTKLPPPGTLLSLDKPTGTKYLCQHQQRIASAQNIVVIGGGAVGVQLTTDIKDYYRSKNVTLIHSHDHLMHAFHQKMHETLAARMAELGVEIVLGDRAQIPLEGFPLTSEEFNVSLQSGRKLKADLVILATGQVPQSDFLRALSPSSVTPSGFISVKPTLQIADDRFPHIFAIGDVADTPNQKTARLSGHHADVATENIAALVHGKRPTAEYEDRGMGIHMSLGMTRDLKFRNSSKEGQPRVILSDTGSEGMKLTRVWEHRAPGIKDYDL